MPSHDGRCSFPDLQAVPGHFTIESVVRVEHDGDASGGPQRPFDAGTPPSLTDTTGYLDAHPSGPRPS